MHYCRFCGKKLEENEICNCVESSEEKINEEEVNNNEDNSGVSVLFSLIALGASAFAVIDASLTSNTRFFILIVAMILAVKASYSDSKSKFAPLVIVIIAFSMVYSYINFRVESCVNSCGETQSSCMDDCQSGRCD